MAKTRLYPFALVLAPLLLFAAWLLIPGPGVNGWQARKVRPGMSLAEVEGLLGGPENHPSFSGLAAWAVVHHEGCDRVAHRLSPPGAASFGPWRTPDGRSAPRARFGERPSGQYGTPSRLVRRVCRTPSGAAHAAAWLNQTSTRR